MNLRSNLIFIAFSLVCASLTAQTQFHDPELILNKQGTFKVIVWDGYNYTYCGFKKTETDNYYKRLVSITEAVRKDPVMQDTKGFNGQVRFYPDKCDVLNGYGIPSFVNFEFCPWFTYKGKEYADCIEPPHWDIEVNILRSVCVGAYDYTAFDPVAWIRDGFNFKMWKSAAEKTNELFFSPIDKKTLAPGVDLYNESNIIIYNPDRPPYWIPVTIREAFKLLYDYWKLRPDLLPDDPLVQELDKEYAVFTEKEKDGYAYAGGEFLSRISSNDKFSMMMRVNPAYWNRNLPRSAIQFMSFYCPADKEYVKSQAERWLKCNASGYNVDHFVATFDWNLLVPIIEK
jgi:hypothetical protein